MKTHINLLAWDILGEGRPSLRMAAPSGVFLLFLTVLLAGTTLEWKRSQSLRKDTLQIDSQHSQLMVSVALLETQVEELARKGELFLERERARQQLLERLNRDRVLWSSLLQELSLIVPRQVWLKEVESFSQTEKQADADRRAERTGIRLSGFAANHSFIIRLLSALDSSPNFKNASLLYSKRSEGAGKSRIVFEIKAYLMQR